ncbi:PH domain-containing protein [Flavobacteriales bacterium]|nr:PH domain-containing protein [Flavobacteriales bacterium]
MKKQYASKVSYTMLAVIFLVIYISVIIDAILGEVSEHMILGISISTLVYIFCLHLFLKTHYTIDNEKLHIKYGLFNFKPIDIQSINEINSTCSLISSPAPSF